MLSLLEITLPVLVTVVAIAVLAPLVYFLTDGDNR